MYSFDIVGESAFVDPVKKVLEFFIISVVPDVAFISKKTGFGNRNAATTRNFCRRNYQNTISRDGDVFCNRPYNIYRQL